MSRVPAGLWQNLIAVQIYGANTGVGKTVVSTLLGKHFVGRLGTTKWSVNYIKPVQTGPPEDSDDRYFSKYAGAPASCLVRFAKPVSPHVAALGSNAVPKDDDLVHRVHETIKQNAATLSMKRSHFGFTIVETAGGVLSPGPQRTPQADLFRPLRLPVVLVGDHRLGGIATTISAYESLTLRGYDIDALVLFDSGSLGNNEYLHDYFQHRSVPVVTIPDLPDMGMNTSADEETVLMSSYYDTVGRSGELYTLGGRIIGQHLERLKTVQNMASRTRRAIWHPFTQHKNVKYNDEISVFDSAYGDFFQMKHTKKTIDTVQAKGENSKLYPAFDGSASWWTQGLGHGNPQLSLAAGYAAGRYGHVMFAGATHKPAIDLAERLLDGLGNPRLRKVFFTDNGSTGTEVAIKMALRAACKRYGWDGSTEEVGIIGLKGSYHGDTIGAMDASEPSLFNKKVDWYRGRGHWFDFPQVKMRDGTWVVEPPQGMEEEFGPAQSFSSLDDVFDYEARGTPQRYEAYITRVLEDLTQKQGRKFGALVMEPVLLGAGGMMFCDPLFQRTLVQVVRRMDPDDSEGRWTGMPVVFDEVFTGLYRLGRFSAASFLKVDPDISVHAKLLTGGLIPLCTTIASQSIFEAFWGDEKSEALLHGHSYTAHPIGCHVANTSLEEMKTLSRAGTWNRYREQWIKHNRSLEEGGKPRIRLAPDMDSTWSMWSRKTVTLLSAHRRVDSVIALGSVLAISLKDESGSGYSSNAPIGLRDSMLTDLSTNHYSVHSRILGNVLYLMASMTSRPDHLLGVEEVLLAKLNDDSIFAEGREPAAQHILNSLPSDKKRGFVSVKLQDTPGSTFEKERSKGDSLGD